MQRHLGGIKGDVAARRLRFHVAEDTEAVLIGVGYAVAKGWATYAGDGQFQITTEGVKALAAIHADT